MIILFNDLQVYIYDAQFIIYVYISMAQFII